MPDSITPLPSLVANALCMEARRSPVVAGEYFRNHAEPDESLEVVQPKQARCLQGLLEGLAAGRDYPKVRCYR